MKRFSKAVAASLLPFSMAWAEFESGQLLIIEDGDKREIVQYRAPEEGGVCQMRSGVRRPTAAEWGDFIAGHEVKQEDDDAEDTP